MFSAVSSLFYDIKNSKTMLVAVCFYNVALAEYDVCRCIATVLQCCITGEYEYYEMLTKAESDVYHCLNCVYDVYNGEI